MNSLVDNLWMNTCGYGATAPKRGYLTDAQNARMERIRVARMLWKGWHRQAFLQEGRTQFQSPQVELPDGRLWKPYITLNILKLISTTITDLLLGEEPLLKVDNDLGQQAIDALKVRSDLHRVFYDATRTGSWAAESMVEIARYDGQVYIRDVNPDDVFPVGPRLPDGQFNAYKRIALADSVEAVPRSLLLETTYYAGRIERQCYFLTGTNKRSDALLSLWPTKGDGGQDLPPVEQTGIAWNTIVWMANELDGGMPTSDYDGLIELQDELNCKQTQLAVVIAKHANPKLAGPQSMVNETGTVPASHDFFPFRTREEIPQYIVWDAQLAAALSDRDFTISAICIAAELSPGLLGLEKGAAPDSARKLRLQATKSLARTKRKATFVKPFIRTALDTALMMMRAGLRIQVAMGGGIAVDLRDGLPVDELDQAQTISMLTGGKATMSVERGVQLQIPDPAAAAEEVARLKDQAAADAPSVFLGDGTAGAGGANAETQNTKPETQNGADAAETPVGGAA